MKVTFDDVDQQSVNGRTARAVNRSTGEVHTVTIAGGEADFGQLTYQQAYEVYGVNAGGTRSTQILIKTETSEPATAPQDAPSLSATVVSATRIDLTIGSVLGATGYEYRVDGGTPVDVGTNRTPQVTGLTPETQYGFEARAYNSEGSGPWSSVVQATTQAAGSGVTITESFDKADGPDIGHDVEWSYLLGSATDTYTDDGVAHFPRNNDSDNGQIMVIAADDLDSPDQYAQVEVLAQIENADPGRSVNIALPLRASMNGDAVYFSVTNQNSRTFRLFKLTAGDTSTLKEIETSPPSVPYTMRGEVEETSGGNMILRGYVDGIEVISTTVPSEYSENRSAGIRVTGGGSQTEARNVQLDNFEAGDL